MSVINVMLSKVVRCCMLIYFVYMCPLHIILHLVYILCLGIIELYICNNLFFEILLTFCICIACRNVHHPTQVLLVFGFLKSENFTLQ